MQTSEGKAIALPVCMAQRHTARVTLHDPIPASACGETVRVVDASVHGVRVAHEHLLTDRDRCPIAFDWNGRPITFVGRVRWTKLQRDGASPWYQSGLEISSIDDRSTTALRKLVEMQVERALEEQRANAHGVFSEKAERTQPIPRPRLYVRHELVDGIWRKSSTNEPRQPSSGFTVPVDEKPDQVDLLRLAYAAADPSMRSMIRRFAELSIADPDATWPNRFIP